MILAIDTSAGTSAAVVSDRILSEVVFEDPFGHAENIGLAISQAMSEAGVQANQITGVAMGRGPAPYTGLRVGMAAALSFAAARKLAVFGVMVFDAVAHSLPEGKMLLVSDAKRREFFAAGYESGSRIFGPEVISGEQLEQMSEYQKHDAVCSAGLVGLYANWAVAVGLDLSDHSAIYLRSPDVSPSPGKRVSG